MIESNIKGFDLPCAWMRTIISRVYPDLCAQTGCARRKSTSLLSFMVKTMKKMSKLIRYGIRVDREVENVWSSSFDSKSCLRLIWILPANFDGKRGWQVINNRRENLQNCTWKALFWDSPKDFAKYVFSLKTFFYFSKNGVLLLRCK